MNDDHRLLPRYRQPVPPDRQKLREAFDNDTPVIAERKHNRHETWTPEDLRGIPVMAPGVGSAIKGTRPHELPWLTPAERAA